MKVVSSIAKCNDFGDQRKKSFILSCLVSCVTSGEPLPLL